MTQKKHHYKKSVLCVHLALMALPAVPLMTYAQSEKLQQTEQLKTNISFSIPSQSLERALLQYAQQADVEILIDSQDVTGLKSHAIQGNLSLKEGLRQLIGSNPIHYSIQISRGIG